MEEPKEILFSIGSQVVRLVKSPQTHPWSSRLTFMQPSSMDENGRIMPAQSFEIEGADNIAALRDALLAAFPPDETPREHTITTEAGDGLSF